MSDIPLPHLCEAGERLLHLESSLGDLSLYDFQVEATYSGQELARIFEEYPLLPGVVILRRGQLVGMLSRQRLLEFLLHPYGLELFLAQPLSVLYSYARTNHLILAGATTILTAAQYALRRSPDQQREPIVVQMDTDSYRLLDVHELNIAYWQIRGLETQVRYERSQAQMIQTEKMAGLGRLVDGVAHEILDPVGFIWGNLIHVSTYTAQLIELLAAYERSLPQPPQALIDLRDDIEIDYLKHDLPSAIESIKTGAERLKNLVSSLQNFCHIDEVYPKPADLHECLDSIVLLLKTRLTGEIVITTDYCPLPLIPCYRGQLSQVLMNILIHAVDALINQSVYQQIKAAFGDRSSVMGTSQPKPQITITTEICTSSEPFRDRYPAAPPPPSMLPSGLPSSLPLGLPSSLRSRWVSIRIANNGPALSSQEQRAILESFSIARRADKETSLAMSYQIVTAKHGGKLYLRSPLVASAKGGGNFAPESAPGEAAPGESADGKSAAGEAAVSEAAADERAPGIGTEFEILLPLA
ncbi:MAG TPA: hypothetical protein V6C88_10885 [Chroococcidiopsis sp.]